MMRPNSRSLSDQAGIAGLEWRLVNALPGSRIRTFSTIAQRQGTAAEKMKNGH